jgi:hypothetical protein
MNNIQNKKNQTIMKTTNSFASFKNAILIFSAAFFIGGISSCNKDASTATPATTTVTEAEAAEAVTDAVVPQSSGLTAQVSDATVMASSSFYTCGLAYDSAITRSSVAGASTTYSLNLAWNWKLSCANPASFAASFKGSSTYTATRMSSSDSSNGSFTITGIEPSNTAYTFNSSYTRQGSQQSKIGNKNSFTSTITVNSSNIQVNKTTQQIVSGTATVSISGASSSGKSFSFNGTITFNGGKTATLVISGGGTYTITW